jgi:hypothetical protein
MDLKKVQKLIEAINTYYGFAVLLYVAALYIATHNQFFWWILLGATPFLAGWTGYLLKGHFEDRNLKHGFRVLSNEMFYEILGDDKYRLHFCTKLKAEANRMMVYPIGYQWSGGTEGSVPVLGDPSQSIVGVVNLYDPVTGRTKVSSYKEKVSSESDWNYWFVGFDHALYKGEEVEIVYTQDFSDKKHIAKPWMYYMVNTTTNKLELSVKFPADALPKSVTSSFTKLNDRRKVYPSKGVEYVPEKQWATWVIRKPKLNHVYRIDWQQ